jgi:hypothetical protein
MADLSLLVDKQKKFQSILLVMYVKGSVVQLFEELIEYCGICLENEMVLYRILGRQLIFCRSITGVQLKGQQPLIFRSRDGWNQAFRPFCGRRWRSCFIR